mmetsp:Transcript_6570/g.15498  ORF Transcript_6570/g.15498 Transcript_6570/m.15498 type:complete len:665 (-) Transcript_6570:2765-4759(-)
MQNGLRCCLVRPRLSWSVTTTPTVLIIVIQAIVLYFQNGETQTESYLAGDHIPLWLDTVGPVNNPQERYPFSSLPYCYPGLSTVPEESGSDCHLRLSGHTIRFQKNSTYRCTHQPLQYEDLIAYYKLIGGGNRYQNSTFRIYLANRPIYGMIGSEHRYTQHSESTNLVSDNESRVSFLLYTRHNLIIATDRTRIIDAYLEADASSLVKLKENISYTQELVVQFRQNGKVDRGENAPALPNGLLYGNRQFSVGIGLFAMISLIWFSARRFSCLKNSKLHDGRVAPRVAVKDETGATASKDGAVYEPKHLSLLAAMTGAGSQLVFVAVVIGHKTWINGYGFIIRGEVIDTFWTSVTLTSFIGAYTLTRIVRVHREPRMLELFDEGVNVFQRELKLDLSDGPAVDSEERMNKAVVFANKQHLLHGVIKESLCIYLLIVHGFHLTVQLILSTIDWWHGKMETKTCSQIRSPAMTLNSAGRKVVLAVAIGVAGSFIGLRGRASTRSKIKIWSKLHTRLDKFGLLQETLCTVMASGFFAFLSLFIEFHALLSSAWSFRSYEVTASAFIVFLLSVSTMVLGTWLSLWLRFASGRLDWQWTAMGSGVSLYVYFIIASAYFYFVSSWMSGRYQALYYWLVMLCVGLDVGLIYGAVSFWSGYSFAVSSSRQKDY